MASCRLIDRCLMSAWARFHAETCVKEHSDKLPCSVCSSLAVISPRFDRLSETDNTLDIAKCDNSNNAPLSDLRPTSHIDRDYNQLAPVLLSGDHRFIAWLLSCGLQLQLLQTMLVCAKNFVLSEKSAKQLNKSWLYLCSVQYRSCSLLCTGAALDAVP